MVTIVNVNNTTFSINGIEYLKNFMSIVDGNNVKILNVYDSKVILQEPTIYSDYTVDGGGFASAALLQSALKDVIFNRDNLGTELGYKIINNLSDLDALITGSAAGVYLFLANITLDGNKIIPADVTLEFRNTQIDLAGFTLTGTGTNINAGLTQIFTTTGAFAGTWGVIGFYPQWFGAKGNGTTDDTTAIQTALNHLETAVFGSYAVGGILNIPKGDYIVSDTILVPEKCGVIGSGTVSTRILLAASTNLGTKGIFENKTKTGIGQEFFFLEKLNIDGNRGNGTTIGACVKLNQVFVNSYVRDCLIGNSSGHGIWLVSSPDGIAAGNGGPIEIQNNWIRTSSKHCLYIDGDFTEVNIYGGAFENPSAGYDCIHIDGTNYSGVRANACIVSPHFEFSNANSKGLYCKKSVVNVSNMSSIGSQLSTQYNVYVDTNVEFTLTGYSGSNGTRKGVYFVDTSTEYDTDYMGIITNIKSIIAKGWYSSGAVGSDITLDMGLNDVVSLSGASATTIANFTNQSADKILVRFSNASYTVRDNANISLVKGSDYAATSGDVLSFVKIGTIWYEIGATA